MPKVSFISNYLNHHQMPFCQKMQAAIGDNFHFISTSPIGVQRKKLGWIEPDASFVVKAYVSENEEHCAMQIADESDAVIIGSAPDKYILNRLKDKKLTFKYSERFYKNGMPLKKLPRAIVGAWLHHGRFQKYPLYMLCASAYTAADVALFGNYINRTYKWGYFTEVKKYDIDALFEKKRRNGRISILWCGRMIDWKHPEAAIEVACRLKADGYDFELNFIGDGPLREELSKLICEKQVGDYVHLLGSMPPEEVRIHMEEADIFLFTSDFNEGWGAVLNESMNSGCAVVASHAIGSVPFLIKHGENGLIYKNGKLDDLYAKTKRLVESAELRRELGERAYYTMADLWNAEVAAERLLQLIDELQKNGQCDLFEDGPCSRAEILKNGWFR